MKISYFPNQVALNSGPILTAFLDSCKHRGWEIVENSLDADAAVIWSVLWAGRMRHNKQVYEHYRRLNKPVFILEIGNLKRGVTWRVSLNHINRNGVFGGSEIDTNRPDKLGVRLVDRASNGTAILIACQRGDSLQWAGQPTISSWVSDIVKNIRAHSDRPIVVRPHPRFIVPGLPSDIELEIPKHVSETYDSFDLNYQKYHCIINHNSGPGVQSVMCDVPTICSVSSLAWPMSINYASLETPIMPDRSSWFLNLCHTEYLIEEIAAGIPLTKLQKYLIS